jgi:hypothetical protein
MQLQRRSPLSMPLAFSCSSPATVELQLLRPIIVGEIASLKSRTAPLREELAGHNDPLLRVRAASNWSSKHARRTQRRTWLARRHHPDIYH